MAIKNTKQMKLIKKIIKTKMKGIIVKFMYNSAFDVSLCLIFSGNKLNISKAIHKVYLHYFNMHVCLQKGKARRFTFISFSIFSNSFTFKNDSKTRKRFKNKIFTFNYL